MKPWSVLAVISMAACGASSGVKGSLNAFGGNDPCHDEDGDPIYFRVEAYESGAYEGYAGTSPLIDDVRVACDAAEFELALPAGRYDIAMIAFQEVPGLGFGFSDLEDEEVVRDVAVVDGRFTSLGFYGFDVNDDDD